MFKIKKKNKKKQDTKTVWYYYLIEICKAYIEKRQGIQFFFSNNGFTTDFFFEGFSVDNFIILFIVNIN